MYIVSTLPGSIV